MKGLLLHAVAAAAAITLLSGCDRMPNVTGPTSTSPGSGPEAEWYRLVDGAGNPGPVKFRWLELSRESSGTVPYGGPDGIVPVVLYSFRIEVCMDPVPNPTNNPNLSGMGLMLKGGDDGNNPIGVTSAALDHQRAPYVVQNGNCVTIKRIPVSRGGTDGEQFLLVDPAARNVLVAATFAPLQFSGRWGNDTCPSVEEIAKTERRPTCVLRFATPLPG